MVSSITLTERQMTSLNTLSNIMERARKGYRRGQLVHDGEEDDLPQGIHLLTQLAQVSAEASGGGE